MKWTGLILVFTLGIGTTNAQTTTGRLEGRVTDTAQNPVSGANIAISGENLQGARGAVSDARGRFQIAALPVGTCQVEISHVAFQHALITGVAIQLGTTTTLGDIRLPPRNVEMPGVTVVAERPLIDPSQTDEGGSLGARTIAQLPVERSYRSVITLIPQANTSYYGDGANIAGATGMENKYFIDGMEVTDPFRGIGGTSLPYNFIQEVQVRTGGYQAEYRSTLGGIVNVITWSGGNEFHGQAFGFFTNNRLSGEPRQPMLAPPRGDYAQYDAGLRLGGPILRDRLWFFAAWNPLREREEVLIPGQGYFTDLSTTQAFAAKLTWQASRRNNLVLTIFGDPQRRRGIGDTFGNWGTPVSFANPDPFLERIRRGGINYSLNGLHQLGGRLLLETQASLLTSQENNQPETGRGRSQSLYVDMDGRWSGGAPSRIDARSRVLTGGLKLTFTGGRHLLKGGLEYRDNSLDFNSEAAAITRLGESDWFVYHGRANGTVHNRLPALFIQDSWQITTRLGLQAGVRWEGQYFIASTGKLAQSIPDQFQPRIGVIFQPGTIGTQKISLSAGRFYEEISTWLSSGYFLDQALTALEFYSHNPAVDPQNPDNSLQILTKIRPALADLSGQYYDALSAGYERRLSAALKVSVSGTWRTLREGIEDGFDPVTGDVWFANPGKDVLKAFPRVKREYGALELRLEKPWDGRLALLAAYILSRTWGNYPGLYNSDFNYNAPNANGSFDQVETLINGTGLLPNDRTHVFKASGSINVISGLQLGLSGFWQSGTPLNEWGGSVVGPPWFSFMQRRGTAGRTPALWDLNMRLLYDLPLQARSVFKPRLILDAFHIGSRRTPVAYEQVHYSSLDESGKNTNPNPLYGRATRFQPPLAVRLGMEVDF